MYVFMSHIIVFFFFFFFQAEDGIRDLTVTGVQTCALPIYFELTIGRLQILADGDDVDVVFAQIAQRGHDFFSSLTDAKRSEERRVGKECRSRWSPYH